MKLNFTARPHFTNYSLLSIIGILLVPQCLVWSQILSDISIVPDQSPSHEISFPIQVPGNDRNQNFQSPTNSRTKGDSFPFGKSNSSIEDCTGNLLFNGGFEDGLNGWTTSGEVFYSNVNYVQEGTNYVYLHSVDNNSTISQNVSNIIPGETYQLSFFGGTHDASFSHEVGIVFYNASGTFTGFESLEIDFIVGCCDPSINYELETYSIAAVAPENSDYLVVIARNYDGDFLKLDGFCLQGNICEPPIAGFDTYNTCSHQAVIGDLSSNDQSLNDPTFEISIPAQSGEVELQPDGNFVYTPLSGFSGEDYFYYQVCNNGGCCTTAKVTIGIKASPDVEVSIVQPSCGEDNGTITFTFDDLNTRTNIEFSIDGGNNYSHEVKDDIGSTSITNLPGGTFSTFVRWGNDECPVYLGDFVLENAEVPSLSIGDDQEICLGESIALNAITTHLTEPITYNWSFSNESSSQISFSPSESASYSLTVVDGNNCELSTSINVTVFDTEIQEVIIYDHSSQSSFKTISSGSTYYLDLLPSDFTLEAIMSGDVDHVDFEVNSVSHTERVVPYRFEGDNFDWEPSPGTYEVSITAYSSASKICDQKTFTIHFEAYATPLCTDANLSDLTYLGYLDGILYYQYDGGKLNYDEAKSLADDKGLRLLKFENAAQNDFVAGLTNNRVWLGMTDAIEEGTFIWNDGSELSYNNWDLNEPNNSNDEDYAEMYSNGVWNDLKGTQTRHVILMCQGNTPVIETEIPEDFLFGCDNSMDINVYGDASADCSGDPDVSVSIPGGTTNAVVEIVYKNHDPGSFAIVEANGEFYSLQEINVSGNNFNAHVYRGVIPETITEVNHSASDGKCGDNKGLQSLLVYAFESSQEKVVSGTYVARTGHCDVVDFTIPLPADDGPRDVEVILPVSEMTDDGRYMIITATAGGKEASTTIYGSDPEYECCLAIPSVVINDVPGSTEEVTVTVDTKNLNGCGQSWVIAGVIKASSDCYQCDPPATSTLNYTICEGASLNGDLSNGEDLDDYSYQIINQPTYGSVDLDEDGSFVYTPTETDYSGLDEFVYQVCFDDGACCSEETIVSITVEEKPTLSIVGVNATCGLTNGSISVGFELTNNLDGFEISLDGGNEFQAPIVGTSGSIIYDQLNPGTYVVVGRWVGSDCLYDFNEIVISNEFEAQCCETLGDPGTEVCMERTVSNTYSCGDGPNYVFWLNWNNSTNHFHMLEQRFVEFTNGTAKLELTVQHSENANYQFYIEVIFINRTTQGSPKERNCGPIPEGSDFYYYENYYGFAKGLGDLYGACMEFEKLGPSFQIGSGANITSPGDTDYGGSGWIELTILSQPTDGPEISLLSNKQADFNLILSGNSCDCYSNLTAMIPEVPKTCPEDSVDIVASVSGGVAPYSYEWSIEAIGHSIRVAPTQTTTFTTTITDAAGCRAIAQTTVEVYNLVEIQANLESPSCGSSNGKIVGSIAGEHSDECLVYRLYNYDIQDWVGNYQLDLTFVDLPAGRYRIKKYIDPNCDGNYGDLTCYQRFPEEEQTYFVLEDVSEPLVVSIGEDQAICPGDAVNFEVTVSNGEGPFSYQWSHELGDNAFVRLLPDASDEYYVTVTDNTGCAGIATANIVVKEEPQFIGYAVIQPSCGLQNGSISLEFEDYNGKELLVSIDGGINFTQFDASAAIIFEALGANTYDVVAKYTTEECEVEIGDIELVDQPGPTLQMFGEAIICEGNSTTITAEVAGENGALSYDWLGYPNATEDQLTVRLLETTSFSVTATDELGCTVTGNFLVEVIPAGTIEIATSNNEDTFCSEEEVLLTATLSGSFTSINWLTSGDGAFEVIDDQTALYQFGPQDIQLKRVELSGEGVDPHGVCVSVNPTISINILTTTPTAVVQNSSLCSADSPFTEPIDNQLDLQSLIEEGYTGGTWLDVNETELLNGSVLTVGEAQAGQVLEFTYVIEGASDEESGSCSDLLYNVIIEVNDCFGSVGDLVWLDENGDGLQGDSEPVMGAVSISLYDERERLVSTISSNPDGSYLFDLLPIGGYFLEVEAPDGYYFTDAGIGNDEENNDVNPTTGTTDVFTITQGSSMPFIDIGLGQFDLRLTKAVLNQPNNGYEPGDQVTYRITLINEGGLLAKQISIKDFAPDDLQFLDATFNNDQVTQTAELTYLIEEIAEGGTVIIDLVFSIDSEFQGFTIENRAEIIGFDFEDVDSTPNNQISTEDDDDSVTIQVNQTSSLQLKKYTNGIEASGPNDAVLVVENGNTPVVWDYEITNTGTLDLVDVVLVDDQEGEICVIDRLEAGKTATCSKEGIAQNVVYSNLATVTGSTVDLSGNIVDEQVGATAISYYTGVFISLEVNQDASTICEGTEIMNTITVGMLGGNESIELRNIRIEDTFLGQFFSIENEAFISESDIGDNGYIDFIDENQDGQSEDNLVFQYPISTSADLEYTIRAFGDLYVDGVMVEENIGLKNNLVIVAVDVRNPAFTIDITPETQSLVEGSKGEYVLSITNTGDAALETIQLYVVDNLIPFETIIPSLPVGANQTLTLTIPTVSDNVVFQIEGVGNALDENGNTICEVVTATTASLVVERVVDLSLVKTVDNESPKVGEQVTFTLTINNAGPSTATGVEVTDQLPDGYTYISDTGNGAYDAASGIWTVGSLEKDENQSLEIVVEVLASGNYNNQATISNVNEEDSNEDNDETDADANTDPSPVVDLSLVKTVDNESPKVGEQVTFTLTINNAGPSTATGVETDQLPDGPDGYTYISDTGNGTYDAASGIWTVGSWKKMKAKV